MSESLAIGNSLKEMPSQGPGFSIDGTFSVSQQNLYCYGLQFRSNTRKYSVRNTGIQDCLERIIFFILETIAFF
jgi:hypothetical protein